MAEKIIIAELDINTEALLKTATNTKAVLDGLRKEQNKLKKDGQAGTEQFIKNDVAIKRLSRSYAQQKTVLQSVNSLNTDFISVEKAATKAIQRHNVSISEARKNNKELTAIRNELNLATKSGQDALVKINAKLDKNNDFIKENVDQYTKQKINIGNYKSALEGLDPRLARNIKLLLQIKTALVAQVSALVGSTTATTAATSAQTTSTTSTSANTTATQSNTKAQTANAASKTANAAATTTLTAATTKGTKATLLGAKALRILKIALISTGIGAIVVAIGALIAAFASTQKGIDAIKRVLAPLKGAFQGIIGVVQNIAINVFGQLKDRWTIVSGAMLHGIDLIRLGWNKLTGDVEEATEIQERMKTRVEEMRGAQERLNEKSKELREIWRGAAEAIGDAARAQRQIVELGIEIEKSENKLIVSRSESNRIIKEQNKIAEDTTKTLKEREAAAKLSISESEKLLKSEQDILDLRIKRLTLEQQATKDKRADEKELAELQAKRNEAETQQLELQTTQTNKLNIIRAQAEAAAAKAIDARIIKAEEELSLLKEQNRFAGESLEDQLELQRKFAAEELKILEQKLAAGKISQIKFNEEKLKLANDLQEKQNQIDEQELLRIKDFEQQKKDLENQIALNREVEEEARAILKAEQDLKKHLLELEDIEIKETEKAELRKKLLESFNQEVQSITDKATEKRLKEQAKADAEEIKLDQLKSNIRLDTAKQLSDLLLGVLGDNIGARFAAIALDAIIEIAKLKIATSSAQQVNLAAATAVSTLNPSAIPLAKARNVALGASSKVQQGKILAEAVVSGLGAALKFYEGGKVPELSAGLITSSQNISNQRGGDNVLATVKRGEVILNRQQQQRAGGSAFFRSIGVPGFVNGGIAGLGSPNVSGASSDIVNLDRLGEIISEKINDVKIVAIEEEITTSQINKVDIVEGARI
jgi:hypothetical protein